MSDMESDLRRNLHTGQFERMNRLGTAIMAKELGLDPVEFAQPFPGNQSITVNHFAKEDTPAKPVTRPPRPGLSRLAALGLGLLGASVPAVGVIAYLLGAAKPAIEKIIEKPGQNYDVDVGMEIIPPKK